MGWDNQQGHLHWFVHPRLWRRKESCPLFPLRCRVFVFIAYIYAFTPDQNTSTTLKSTVSFPASAPRELSDENPNWQA